MTDNLKIRNPFHRSFELWRESPKDVFGEAVSTSTHHPDITAIAQERTDISELRHGHFAIHMQADKDRYVSIDTADS